MRWIDDRLPEWEDSDTADEVWVFRSRKWKLAPWGSVLKGEAWCHTNRPAASPEPQGAKQ